MRWFKTHGVCEQCGVYFSPRHDPYGKTLCVEHSLEQLALDRRRDTVHAWVAANFYRLEKQMQEEQEAAKKAFFARGSAQGYNPYSNAAAMQEQFFGMQNPNFVGSVPQK